MNHTNNNGKALSILARMFKAEMQFMELGKENFKFRLAITVILQKRSNYFVLRNFSTVAKYSSFWSSQP